MQLLSQRRSDKQRVVSKTMALRAKLNKLGVVMRERQNKVDEQIAEIDKHNAIINTTEKEMLRLRKQYEVSISTTHCLQQCQLGKLIRWTCSIWVPDSAVPCKSTQQQPYGTEETYA